MAINCFDNINIHELRDAFKSKVTASMSDEEQKVIAAEEILKYYQILTNRLNGLKDKMKVPKTLDIASIKLDKFNTIRDNYQNKINLEKGKIIIKNVVEEEYSRVAGLSNKTSRELMEDITSRLMNNFFGEKATLSIANLSDNKKINIDEYYDAIKPLLIGNYMAYAEQAMKEGDEEYAKSFLTLAQAVDRDWKDIVEMNKDGLKVFNLVFNESEEQEQNEEEQVDDNPEQTFSEHNKAQNEYDRDIFTLSGKMNASAGIRLLLSTIKDAYYPNPDKEDFSVIPKFEFKKSSIKGAKFLNYTKAFNQLANALVNTNKLENILQKLVNHAKQNAPFADLIRKLKINTADGKINYAHLSYNEWRVLLDFAKTFSKQTPQAFIYTSNGETAQFLPGNKQSGIQQIVNNFTRGVKNNKALFNYRSSDKTYVINPAFFQTYKDVSSDEAVIKFLNAAGFKDANGESITLPQLKRLKGKVGFKDAVAQIFKQLKNQKPIFDTKNKALQLRTPINTIAEGIVNMTKDDGLNTFFNIKGKPVQSIVLPNPLATFFNNFNSVNTLEELYEEEKGLKEGFSENSVKLEKGGQFINKEGRRTGNNIEVGYFDGTKTPKNTRQSAKASLIQRRLNSFNLNLRGWYIPITNGDKKTEWMLSMGNEISYSSVAANAQWDKVYSIFQNYLKTELDVAKTDSAKNLVALEGRKGKLRFFLDILPEKLVNLAHSAIDHNEDSNIFVSQHHEEINMAVKKFMEKEMNKTKTEFTQYRILEKIGDTNSYFFKGIDEGFVYNNINDNGNNKLSEKQVNDTILYRTINQIINNIEIHKLFIGDPAFISKAAKYIPGAMGGVNQSFYGNDDFNSHFSTLLNRVDVHNSSLALKPTDYGWASLKDNVPILVYKDIIVDGATGKAYKGTNETDGFSKMTLPAYRVFKSRAAEWTDQQEIQYQYQMAYFRNKMAKEKKYKYSSKKLEIHDIDLLEKGQPQEGVFEIIKPKSWGQNQNSAYKDNVYLKTSTQPLIPTALISGSNDEKLLKKMLDEGIDIAAFNSSIKIGERNSESFYNKEGEFNQEKYNPNSILSPSWKDLGIQVETQFSQGKTTLTFGSQLSTLSALNLLSGGVPAGFTQAEWAKLSEEERESKSLAYKYVKENNQILTNLIQNGYKTLLKKLGIEETATGYEVKDYQIVLNYLLEQTRDMDDNTKEALQVDNVLKGFKTPLEAIPTYTSLKAVLYSIVDKNIASPKVGGIGLVQMPTTGTESENRATLIGNSTHKFYTKEEPWIEVSLPAWFRDKLEVWYIRHKKEIPTDEQLLALINDSSILSGIGFRIPTQEMNSIEVFKVKRFLPRVMGNAVIVPTEITTKAGSDFDIDKLNTYLKNIFINSKGEVEKIPSFNSEQEAVEFFQEDFDKRLEQAKKNLQKAKASVYFKQSKAQDYAEELLTDEQIGKYADLLNDIFEDFDDPSDAGAYFMQVLEGMGAKEKKLNDETLQSVLKQQFVESRARKSLENAYYESLERLVQLPENYERLIAHNTSDYLEGIKNTLNKALYTEKEIKENTIDIGGKPGLSYLFLMSPNSLDEIRHNLITGKDGVGISAAAQKSNSIMQRLPVVMDISRKHLYGDIGAADPHRLTFLGDGVIRFPHNTFNGKPTISSIKTKKGLRYISDVISQYINGFVDVTKKTFIIEMGVNTRTAGLFLLMDRLGNDTDHTTYFMNQPIIREYLKDLDKEGINGIRSIKVIAEIYEKWGNHRYEGDEMLPNSKGLLDNIEYYKEKNRDINNLSAEFIQEQSKIFHEFLKYQEMASDLFNLMQGISWDTAHISDPENILLKNQKYVKANHTLFTPASEILSKVFIGEVRTNVLKARDAIGSFLTLEHPLVRQVLDQVKLKMINPTFFPSEDDWSRMAKRVNNSFINYIMQTKGKITPELLKVVLLNEQTSAAAMLEDLKSRAAKNSDIYEILQQFTVVRDGNDADSIKGILFRKSGNEAKDRNTDIDSLRILKENGQTYELYRRLVAAALLQTGVQYTRESFSHLIPNEDYAAVLSDIMKQLPQYPDLDNFLVMDDFVRNNWATSDIIPSVSIPKNLVVDRTEDGGDVWAANFKLPAQLAKFPLGSIYNTTRMEGEYIKFQPLNTQGVMKYIPSNNSLIHGPTAYTQNNPKLTETYLYKLVRDEQGNPLTITETNRKTGVEYIKYIYRAINAWGKGELAQEHYDHFETNNHGEKPYPGASKIANNTYYVDESLVNNDNILKAFGRTTEFSVNLKQQNIIKDKIKSLWTQYSAKILKKNPKATLEIIEKVAREKGIEFVENYLKQCYG